MIAHLKTFSSAANSSIKKPENEMVFDSKGIGVQPAIFSFDIKMDKIRSKARGSQTLYYMFSKWHC